MPVDQPATKCPSLPGLGTAPDWLFLVRFSHHVCYSILREKNPKFQVPSANRSLVLNEKHVGDRISPYRKGVNVLLWSIPCVLQLKSISLILLLTKAILTNHLCFRLRHLLNMLDKGEVSPEIIQNSIEYALRVLETFNINERLVYNGTVSPVPVPPILLPLSTDPVSVSFLFRTSQFPLTTVPTVYVPSRLLIYLARCWTFRTAHFIYAAEVTFWTNWRWQNRSQCSVTRQ